MSRPVVILSRRNLLTLLSKLDRRREGQGTLCAMLKEEPESVLVIAAEDSEVYADREPGKVLPVDEPEYTGPRRRKNRDNDSTV